MVEIFNPFENDEVVGVISAEHSEAIVTAAERAGFSPQVVTDSSAVDVDGDDESGAYATILRFFQKGEEKDTLRHFEQRLEKGDHVIRLLDIGDRAEEAGRFLADNDAEVVWHFGKWTYKPLHAT